MEKTFDEINPLVCLITFSYEKKIIWFLRYNDKFSL